MVAIVEDGLDVVGGVGCVVKVCERFGSFPAGLREMNENCSGLVRKLVKLRQRKNGCQHVASTV